MAPSPELGQPKAPDKGDSKVDEIAESGENTESTNKTEPTPSQQDSENLSCWDDRKLKALLDEAITYKRPRDREHKSKKFNELLHRAELEEQEPDFVPYGLIKRNHHGSNRHTQGGSLQDLAETDNLDDIFGHTKKYHHLRHKHSSVSSRQREGGSLPSNVNVSLSGCNICPFETPFINEVNNKKKNKNTDLIAENPKEESQSNDNKLGHTVTDISKYELEESQSYIAYETLSEDVIDSIPNEDYSAELTICQKIPRVQTHQRHYTSQAKIEINDPSSRIQHTSVDKTVPFALVDESITSNVDMTPVQLNASYSSVESIVGNKTEVNQRIIVSPNAKFLQTALGPQQKYDENTVQQFNSSLPTSSQPNRLKYKKISKSERNTIEVDYSKKEGYRGDGKINDLVRYILDEPDNDKGNKQHSSINSNNNNNGTVLNNTTKKTKNNSNSAKKEGKLKKCNSLEELSSCSKLKELKEQNVASIISTTNPSSASSTLSSCASSITSNTNSNQTTNLDSVTLRSKNNSSSNSNKKNNSDPSTSLNKKSQQKRSERRSWGTEELGYLGDSKINNNVEFISGKDENTTDSNNNNDENSSIVFNKKNNIKTNLTSSSQLLSVVSIESIPNNGNSETAEFLLVTKKKKPKKKLEDTKNINNNNNHNQNCSKNNSGNNHNNNNRGQNRSKYNNSNNNNNNNSQSNFTNDRDVYFNSFNSSSDNNRRKSTSSVPPSERSDSSDLDSVHSLPVESTSSKRLTSSSSQTKSTSSSNASKQSQISYADIAKTHNNNRDNLANGNNAEKWPTVSDNKSDIVIENNDITTKLQLSYSKSLIEIKTVSNNNIPNGDIITLNKTNEHKNQFHKSKSVESDNYNVNIDQYPALEKTVKKTNTLPNTIIYTETKLKSNNNISTISSMSTTSVISTPQILASSFKEKDKKKNFNNQQQLIATINSTPKKIEPIEVSQIEKNMVDELYHRKNKITTNNPTVLKQVVVNDNNNININKLNEFTHGSNSIVVPSNSLDALNNNITNIRSTTSIKKSNSNNYKKDKSNNNHNESNINNLCRPAVIILNDNNNDKTNNDITFGFEINQNLLFGDFDESELKLFEQNNSTDLYNNNTKSNNIKKNRITNNNNSDISDYFSISESSFEASNTKLESNLSSSQNQQQTELSRNNISDNISENINSKTNNENKIIWKLKNNQLSEETMNIDEEGVVSCEVLDNSNIMMNKVSNIDKHLQKGYDTELSNINFKAPEHNHDKIVNFIGTAWEDIISGTNSGTQYYNGQ